MGKIQVLDKQIAELIAAGEVVDRPASVIKELVENAIDAGATAITVEIKNGGVTFMRVTDNGCGIAREDVPTAFLRHATSKIRKQDDLEAIGTLGFRGEALASGAAVANGEVMTRTADELAGTFYAISGGEQQMTLIARALVQEPEFIMMDEPTSNLDYGNQIQVLKRVVELKNSGKGVVMITHSPDQAFLCADEAVLFFRDGSVVSGEVRDVLTEENISRLYGVEIEIDTGKNRDGAASAWCRPVSV